MHTTPDPTPLPDEAERLFADRKFRQEFPRRLGVLAGLLNAIAASGEESTQFFFFAPMFTHVSELATELAIECAVWAKEEDAA